MQLIWSRCSQRWPIQCEKSEIKSLKISSKFEQRQNNFYILLQGNRERKKLNGEGNDLTTNLPPHLCQKSSVSRGRKDVTPADIGNLRSCRGCTPLQTQVEQTFGRRLARDCLALSRQTWTDPGEHQHLAGHRYW